jgi:hypothetical protein
MMKLKCILSSHSIKNGSFQTWVSVVVSIVKAAGADESALPSSMCLKGATNVNGNPTSSSKSKGYEKRKLRTLVRINLNNKRCL